MFKIPYSLNQSAKIVPEQFSLAPETKESSIASTFGIWRTVSIYSINTKTFMVIIERNGNVHMGYVHD